MALESDHLAERFAHVFDTPEPPSALEPHRLLEQGQRMARRRRTTRVKLGASAALACGLAAGVVFVSSPGRPTPAAHHGTTVTDTDPLTIAADFGWLPGPTGTTVYAGGTLHDFPSVWRSWTAGTVQVSDDLRWNVSPPSFVGVKSVGTVDGGPAYVVSGVLYFKSPDGQWVWLSTIAFPPGSVSGDSSYIPIATQLDIARAVRFTPRQIALPIRIAGLDAEPARVTYTANAGGTWNLSAAFNQGPIAVTVEVQPGSPPTQGRILPGFGIWGGGPKVASKTSNGLGISVGTTDSHGTATGDPAAFLARITSLGTNPDNWTTRPLVG